MTKRRLPRQKPKQDLSLLALLHRGDTGYVHLQSQPGARYGIEDSRPVPATLTYRNHRYEGSIPVEILHAWHSLLPEIREHLMGQVLVDGRASVHTVYRPKRWPTKDDYQRLNAAMLDLDCRELEYEEAFARVARLVADKVLPPFSIVTNTGNGLHVFWLLRGDENRPDMPPRAGSRNRTVLVDLNRALVERVRAVQPELQPDEQPLYVTTHTRVPGSVNTRTNSTVVMTLNLTREGLPPFYTLDGLREFLNVPVRESSRRARAGRPDGTLPNPVKQRAHRARYEQLLLELELIGRSRNGFSEGHRRHAVYLLATFMHRSGYAAPAIYKAAEQLGSECRPRLDRSEAAAQAKSGMDPRRRPPRNTTIAEKLGVTLDEANDQNLQKIRPDFEALPATAGGTKGRKIMGVAVLQQLVQRHGPVLPFTYESLRLELQARHGLNPSRGTVQNWLAAAGAQVAGHRGKYKQPSQQTDLADLLGGTGDGPVN